MRQVTAAAASLALALLIASPTSTQLDSAVNPIEAPLGLDLYMPVPEGNPTTGAKVALGRKLFHDPILSSDHTLSCASCHEPQRAFTDGRTVAVGVFGRQGTRNVPTLVNRGYGASHFWDGRAASLEEQVLEPVQDPNELDLDVATLVARLEQHNSYPELFQSAFSRPLNRQDLARALASYVRTIRSGNAPIDRYRAGQLDGLSEAEHQGLRIFQSKGNCTACHLGPLFSDEGFHNTGVAWHNGKLLDPGRFVVTSEERDRGAFKTPTLREISRTAPYMHDGSLATLREVIAFYDRGGNPNPHLDHELRPLHLTTEEKEALLAFLLSLSGDVWEGMGQGVGNSPVEHVPIEPPF